MSLPVNFSTTASGGTRDTNRAPLHCGIKRPVYIAITLLLATLACFTSSSAAQSPAAGSDKLHESVLFLKSEENETCGTGFVIDGGLVVTNAHVVRALCPTGSCNEVQLLRASRVGSRPIIPVEVTGLHVEQILPALDIAFLRAEGMAEIAKASARTDAPVGGEAVVTLGYPKCGALTESRGSISNVESLRLSSSTRGAHGSSGSPVFDEQGRLIGVIGESASISGGLLSLFTDYRFETVAIRADKALSLRGLSSTESIARQSELLLEHYRQHVRPLSGTTRMRAGVAFTAAFDGLHDQVLFEGRPDDTFYRFAFAGQHLDYLAQSLPPQDNAASRVMSSLVLAYNLEVNGAYQQALVPVKTEQLFNALEAKNVSREVLDDWRELISYATESHFPGMELYGLFLAGLTTIIGVFILGVLAWSMGYTFGAMPGSFGRRLLWMLATIVMWPIPPWLARRRRRALRAG